MKSRRELLGAGAHACAGAVALAAMGASAADAQTSADKPAPQRFLLVGLCGSENPTRSNFPFVWAAALTEAGNEVRIELAGDATVMMRTTVANNVTAVGWPPFKDALAKVVALKIPIFV
ncbi:MAG TPA: hypothetical protein VKH43_00275 [Thermoanaerobaculia bacterium]|nr:hypothetical protein [Thermoanaerobaculia bacterium]